MRGRVVALLVRLDAAISRVPERYEQATGRIGRLATLCGVLAACAPALGQVVRWEFLEALRTLGEAVALLVATAAVLANREREKSQ